MFKLPQLETPEISRKYPIYLVLPFTTVFYFIIYLCSGTFYIGEAINVPTTIVDQMIPFMPWTVWIYLVSYGYLFICFFITDDSKERDNFIWSFLLLSIASCLIFFIAPTTVPRSEFSVSDDVFFLTKLSMDILRMIDVPSNCLPSLHVSTATLCYLFIKRVKKRWHLLFLILSILISFSTMSTKQHHFYDCLAGLFFGLFFYKLVFKTRKLTT